MGDTVRVFESDLSPNTKTRLPWVRTESTGRIVSALIGTPPAATAGTTGAINVDVNKGHGVSLVVRYRVVRSVAPTFDPTTGSPVTVGTLFTDTVQVPEASGVPGEEAIEYTLAVTGNPAYNSTVASFDADTRVINIHPPAGSQGIYALTVTAKNGRPATDPAATYTVQLTVTETLVPRFARTDGGNIYLLKDTALTEDGSTLNAVIQIPEVAVGQTPVTYSIKADTPLNTGLAFGANTRKIGGNPTEDSVDGTPITVVATNIAGSHEYNLRIFVRTGVAPVLPADPTYDFAFIVEQRSILRFPGVTNPDTVYPPPVYSLSTEADKQGPSDRTFNPTTRELIAVATEAEETATETTSAEVVLIATNIVGNDDYSQSWKALTRNQGTNVPSLDPPDSLLDQILTSNSVIGGLGWIPDTSRGANAGNGILLILDSAEDSVSAISLDNGVYSRALSYEIPSSTIRAAYAQVFPEINNTVIVPTGICYVPDTDTIYILDSISGHIFAFAAGTGIYQALRDIPASVVTEQIDQRIGGEPSGITYNGRYLMVAIAGFEILAIDPVTKTAVPSNTIDQGYIADSPAGPSAFVTGVSWTGQYILALDSRTDQVFGFLNGRYDALHDLGQETLRTANESISPSGITYITNGAGGAYSRVCFIADAYDNKVHAFRFDQIQVARPPNDYTDTPEELPQPIFTDPTQSIPTEVIDSIWPQPNKRIVGCTYDALNDVVYVVNQFAFGRLAVKYQLSAMVHTYQIMI